MSSKVSGNKNALSFYSGRLAPPSSEQLYKSFDGANILLKFEPPKKIGEKLQFSPHFHIQSLQVVSILARHIKNPAALNKDCGADGHPRTPMGFCKDQGQPSKLGLWTSYIIIHHGFVLKSQTKLLHSKVKRACLAKCLTKNPLNSFDERRFLS